MRYYDYLIIGGGMAADAAVKGIREVDGSGSIGVVGEEADPPYARPPLSKKLWQGKPLESIWRHTENAGAELHPGRRVEAVDAAAGTVRDDRGETFAYGKLLLATGGKPRRLPVGGDDVIYFRTLSDYRRLRDLTERGSRFAVVGGGFIGSEIAAALAMSGKEVTMVFPERAICSRVFPADIGGFLNGYYRDKGVRVITGEAVADVRRSAEELVVTTAGGTSFAVDGIVAGIGIEPDRDLAGQCGAIMDNGIRVNEFLQCVPPHIYAAGDIASVDYPVLGGRYRLEHEDNALAMGRQAGRNMAGAGEPYAHLPFFYSDLFDVGYEAVGDLDGRLETVADWVEPYRKGVVYYLRGPFVRGVLLWNVWDQVEKARELILSRREVQPADLKGLIPGPR